MPFAREPGKIQWLEWQAFKPVLWLVGGGWRERPEIRFALSRGFANGGRVLGRFTRGGRAPRVALDPGLISSAHSGLSDGSSDRSLAVPVQRPQNPPYVSGILSCASFFDIPTPGLLRSAHF